VPYTINADAHRVEVTLVGRLGYETIAAMLDELAGLANAAQPAALSVLVDETDASPGLLNPLDIRRWIDNWKRATALKQGRIAVVAPTLVMFGLNRMAHGLAGRESNEHLAVFRDRAAAEEWLCGPGKPLLA
jgi:hypothetical protein